MSSTLMKIAVKLCRELHKSGAEAMGREIAGIVEKHSIGASVSALGTAWLPGAGSTAAMAACAGFVWSMYFRINAKLGVPFHKNILKSVATAIGTNLAGAAVGTLALSTVLSFTGFGNVGSSLLMTGVCYAITFSSGLVYLKVLERLANAKADLENVSEEELKATAKDVLAHEDIKGMMKEAKSQFKEAKARGDIRKGGGEVEPLEDQE